MLDLQFLVQVGAALFKKLVVRISNIFFPMRKNNFLIIVLFLNITSYLINYTNDSKISYNIKVLRP